jgi:hypothetical protein
LQPRGEVVTVQRHALPVSHGSHIQHAGVIEDQQAEGEYTQCVDIMAASHAEIPLGSVAMLVRRRPAVLRQVTDGRVIVTNGGQQGTKQRATGGVARRIVA